MRVGILSDTHGLLRPEVRAAFAGASHILHAGDIGDIQVLRDLEQAFNNKREGRAGWPRFKNRHTTPNAFRFPQSVRLEGNAVPHPRSPTETATGGRT